MMGKDDGPKPAKDGQPNGGTDDLDERRRRQAAGGNGSDPTAASIEDRAGEGETGEEDDGQLFVWEQGRKVTLGTLIARGTPVEHAFVFGGKRLKGSGGLVGMDDDVLLVSRGRMSKTAIVPTRNDEEKVTKVVVETHITAKVVVNADSDEAMSMLAGVIEKRGAPAMAEA